jgi:hypothetical protein
MTAKVWRRVAAGIAAGVSALALLAVTAAAALAAPTEAVNGRLVVLGSTGAVRFQPQNTLSTGGQVAMLATAAAIIVVVGGVALILDRQSRSRSAAVPLQPAGDEWQAINEGQADTGRPSSEHDQERKAA